MAHTRAPSFSAAVLTVASVLISNSLGCGHPEVAVAYFVGGTVTGLNGTLTLANNGGDTVTVTAPGAFRFTAPIKRGAAYEVTVSQAPAGQTCTVSNGKGTVDSGDISSVVVTCSEAAYTLGGSVAGLTGSLVLANGSATVDVAAGATSFVFAAPLAQGAPYAVTVQTQPTGQRCDVTAGSGTVAGANVTSVAVSCAATHALKVSVSGMIGDSDMTLTDNANDKLVIHSDSTDNTDTYGGTFATSFVAGDAYSVVITLQPQSSGAQTSYCTMQKPDGTAGTSDTASGTVATSDVTVSITCVQAVTLEVNVLRRGSAASTHVLFTDDHAGDTVESPGDTPGDFDIPFQQSYPDKSTYQVHMEDGVGCSPCPQGAQQAVAPASGGAAVDITGTFDGDATVFYACGVACPVVN